MILNIVLDVSDSKKCSVYLDKYCIKDKDLNHNELVFLKSLGDNSIKLRDIYEEVLSATDFIHLANEGILIEINSKKNFEEFKLSSDLYNEIQLEYEKVSSIKTIDAAVNLAQEMNYEIKYIKYRGSKYSKGLETIFSRNSFMNNSD